MERTIIAPEKELLTAQEAAAWLSVGIDVFKDMVRDGTIPAPIRLSRKTVRWPWLDVVAVAHLLARQGQKGAKKGTKRKTD